MNDSENSLITERIIDLDNKSYLPPGTLENLEKIAQQFNNDSKLLQNVEELQEGWRKDLLEAFICIDKLRNTIVQYEDEMILMIQQIEALLECSNLIKEYSIHLKVEVEKVADKIDKEGIDQKIDQLVTIIEEMKPRKHLTVVRDTKIINFPSQE